MVYRVIIPTLNAAQDWDCLAPALLSAVSADKVLIIDSSSKDNTVALARSCGFAVHVIAAADFDHGGTRQLALSLFPDVDIFVYMTQDAILENAESINRLLDAFEDPLIGAAFGRQLPRPGASPIEAHARRFNYPSIPNVRSMEDRDRLGLKTIFISNSFAAYRRSALEAVGGFPSNTIFGEDTLTAAAMLPRGWKIAYVADAAVYHSHAYSLLQEFRRNFDIGVAHARNSSILTTFGRAGGEGLRFVKSETRYLLGHAPWLLPSAFVRTSLKLLGYRLGMIEDKIPPTIKRYLSMNRRYWAIP